MICEALTGENWQHSGEFDQILLQTIKFPVVCQGSGEEGEGEGGWGRMGVLGFD